MSSLISFAALLLAAVPCDGMRKKLMKDVVLRDRMSARSATRSFEEDPANAAEHGREEVRNAGCYDVTSNVTRHLQVLEGDLTFLRQRHPDGNFDVSDREVSFRVNQIQDIGVTVATEILTLDEKRCLKESLQDPDIQSAINSINLHRMDFAGEETQASSRWKHAISRLASWQDGLVAMGTSMLDRDELYPKEVEEGFGCPQPCMSCTDQHNSFFKDAEQDKFKCMLDYKDALNPPSETNNKYSCETPKRRMWKFWEYKTWCTVPSWVMDAYQNARISAMVTCGSYDLVATMKANTAMTEGILRTCMLSEQHMVVTMSDLEEYSQFMSREGDGVVGDALQHYFGVLMTAATAQGLVGLRDTANMTAPSDDNWERLLTSGDYTLLPPELMHSVPCPPPITAWQVFMGGFAAVIGIGSAVMLGLLATIPMLLVTGFFYILAGIALLANLLFTASCDFGCHSIGANDLLAFPAAIVGVGNLVARAIPGVFINVFATVSTKVYNLLVPAKPVSACPQGLLFMNDSPPICVNGMEKFGSERYTCPANTSKSIVITCEPDFNGVAAIRGSPCPGR